MRARRGRVRAKSKGRNWFVRREGALTADGAAEPDGPEGLADRLASSTVAVIGDAMLDRYVRGDVRRISPEAPVPVVRVREVDAAPGGAANVAAGVAALGARCRLVAAVGDDPEGGALSERLSEAGVNERSLLELDDRPTTVKTRVVGRGRQMLRLDRESREPVGAAAAGRIVEASRSAMDGVDAVAVADYGKGLLTGRLLRELLRTAREKGVPAVVDPCSGGGDRYRGATVLTPNAREASEAARGAAASSPDEGLGELRRRLGVEHLLVTLGSDGMRLAGPGGASVRIPPETVEVYDVTGAGDTVTAVLVAALPVCGSVEAAARLANRAAALEVQKRGARPVKREELTETLRDG